MIVKTTKSGNKIFWCPGCKGYHSLTVRKPNELVVHPSWAYNNNPDKPTFEPSILARVWENGDDKPPEVCHSFVTDGQIQFLDDCTHELVGQTIGLPEWPHADGEFGGLLD